MLSLRSLVPEFGSLKDFRILSLDPDYAGLRFLKLYAIQVQNGKISLLKECSLLKNNAPSRRSPHIWLLEGMGLLNIWPGEEIPPRPGIRPASFASTPDPDQDTLLAGDKVRFSKSHTWE
jgi:hypothetical protein